MNVKREILSSGFKSLEDLLAELKCNGKLIEDLPYPLRFHPEVILSSVQKYSQAIKYIDKDCVSDTFLVQIFINNIEAFIKLNPHISEKLFKLIINNISNVKNLKTDTKLQDKLYEVFEMLPIKYITEYKELLCYSEFFMYYSSKRYMSKFSKNKVEVTDVIEKILAFESAHEARDFNEKEKIRLLLDVFIPKFGNQYFEIFTKYINSRYTVNDIIRLYQKPYFIKSYTDDFIFYYIKTLSNAYDVLNLLYGFFDYSDDIELRFDYEEDNIINYFSSLLSNVYIDQAIFADKLFLFLVKNTNIDLFKLIQMFKNYIHFVDPISRKYCKNIEESYNYLLNSVTDKEEIKFLEFYKR